MANIIEVLQRYITPYSTYIIAFIVFIIFIIAAKYAYDTYYVKQKNDKNAVFKDVANANRQSTDVMIYFFNVDWCPHCKKAKPEWDKFKNKMNGKEVNGYKLNCVDMNCTEETPEITRVINEYHIEGYPTVKMLKDGEQFDFDSKITTESLEVFVETMV